jgi:hypothetical protein
MGKSWAVETLPSATNRLTWEYCAPSGTRTPNPVDRSLVGHHALRSTSVLVSRLIHSNRSSAMVSDRPPWCDVSGPQFGASAATAVSRPMLGRRGRVSQEGAVPRAFWRAGPSCRQTTRTPLVLANLALVGPASRRGGRLRAGRTRPLPDTTSGPGGSASSRGYKRRPWSAHGGGRGRRSAVRLPADMRRRPRATERPRVVQLRPGRGSPSRDAVPRVGPLGSRRDPAHRPPPGAPRRSAASSASRHSGATHLQRTRARVRRPGVSPRSTSTGPSQARPGLGVARSLTQDETQQEQAGPAGPVGC